MVSTLSSEYDLPRSFPTYLCNTKLSNSGSSVIINSMGKAGCWRWQQLFGYWSCVVSLWWDTVLSSSESCGLRIAPSLKSSVLCKALYTVRHFGICISWFISVSVGEEGPLSLANALFVGQVNFMSYRGELVESFPHFSEIKLSVILRHKQVLGIVKWSSELKEMELCRFVCEDSLIILPNGKVTSSIRVRTEP